MVVVYKPDTPSMLLTPAAYNRSGIVSDFGQPNMDVASLEYSNFGSVL